MVRTTSTFTSLIESYMVFTVVFLVVKQEILDFVFPYFYWVTVTLSVDNWSWPYKCPCQLQARLCETIKTKPAVSNLISATHGVRHYVNGLESYTGTLYDIHE